jgi:hypothetical protein
VPGAQSMPNPAAVFAANNPAAVVVVCFFVIVVGVLVLLIGGAIPNAGALRTVSVVLIVAALAVVAYVALQSRRYDNEWRKARERVGIQGRRSLYPTEYLAERIYNVRLNAPSTGILARASALRNEIEEDLFVDRKRIDILRQKVYALEQEMTRATRAREQAREKARERAVIEAPWSPQGEIRAEFRG